LRRLARRGWLPKGSLKKAAVEPCGREASAGKRYEDRE
jgi:hypothetical protein